MLIASLRAFALSLLVGGALNAQVPLNLTPINPLQPSGSDAQAVQFNNAANTTINPYINANTLNIPPNPIFFPPNSTVSPPTTLITDPSQISLAGKDVRVYFLSAPAANKLSDYMGYNANHDFTLTPAQQALIFSPSGSGDPNSPSGQGDFVNLGTLGAGASLADFFLLARDSQGNVDTFWNLAEANPDGAPQADTIQFLNTPYYLIAWEDTPLATGNGDFRDLFAVIEVNSAVVPVPEPSTYLMMGLLVGLVLALSRKHKKLC